MISSYHDDLDSGRTALGDGVGHGGTGRVDHGHQTDETKSLQGEVHLFRVELESLGELVLGQLEVAETVRIISMLNMLNAEYVPLTRGLALPFLPAPGRRC